MALAATSQHRMFTNSLETHQNHHTREVHNSQYRLPVPFESLWPSIDSAKFPLLVNVCQSLLKAGGESLACEIEPHCDDREQSEADHLDRHSSLSDVFSFLGLLVCIRIGYRNVEDLHHSNEL